jgi:hypothetical protein
MKKILSLLVFLVTIQSAFGQIGDTLHVYTYGGIQDDYARQIISTNDSGFIVVGTTASFGNGNTDVYVVKLDSNGRKIWTKVYGTSAVEWGYSIRQTYDQGYIITGFTNQMVANGYDVYLLKIDSAGTFNWQKSIGGTDWDFGYALDLAPDSGFIICGKSYSYTNGGSDVFIVKTDSNGTINWQKNYGGTLDESGNAIIKNRDNSYFITGETNSFGTGDKDLYALKINSSGDTLWTKIFGTTKFDAAYGVDTTLDSNYVLIGTSFGDLLDTLSSQIIFLKIDSLGNEMWRQYQGADTFPEEGYLIKQLPSGEFLTGGMTESFGLGGKAFYLLRCDNNGNFIAGANFGETESDEGYSAAIGKDNKLLLAGITDSYGCGFYDMYILRINTYAIVSEHPPAFVMTCDSLIAVNEINFPKPSFTIFPNPTHNYFTVSSQSDLKDYTITINDITGRLVKSIPVVKSQQQIAVADILNKGVYFVSFLINDKEYQTRKLVVY